MRTQTKIWAGLRWLAGDERGVEIVEFIGFFPLVLLMLAIAWQFYLVGYTGVIASGAAREAARAAATREDVDRAVRAASPGFDERRAWAPLAGYPCNGGNQPVTVQVRLGVPHVIFSFFGALNAYPWMTATATARCEPPPRA
jgi:Flp pilus assembly protein TadG